MNPLQLSFSSFCLTILNFPASALYKAKLNVSSQLLQWSLMHYRQVANWLTYLLCKMKINSSESLDFLRHSTDLKTLKIPISTLVRFRTSRAAKLQLEVDQGNSPIFLQLQKVFSYSIRCVRWKCIFRHSSLKKAPFGIFDERTTSEKWRKDPEQGFLVCINHKYVYCIL